MSNASSVNRYRQYAADCVRQAQDENAPEDKTIMLNVALAWLRLAQQSQVSQNQASDPNESQSAASEFAASELVS